MRQENRHNGRVPKINAPTVAEHRVLQRNTIVAAAKAIIAEQGVASITPRSVGQRAGLARSSFYEYFPSRDDLLAAVALEAFEKWAAALWEAMEPATTPQARLHAYVNATMRMTKSDEHCLATALLDADLSPRSRDALMQMHDVLVRPLHSLLEDLGVTDLRESMVLVQGVMASGMRLVGQGVDPERAARITTDLLERGIAR